ncbi:fumarylacetoacetate hydrolase family protein [Streptomyces sp. NPDC058953]|uniref:fumarylacetoacetate hydrolase family protein n=1 Tax=unclassified Streptomyces TaxID=2593676 RepID=UPI00367CAF50
MVEQRRYIRFEYGNRVRFGRIAQVVDDHAPVELLTGDPMRTDAVGTGELIPMEAVRMLAPVIPGKIVAVGRNYADHIAEMGMGAPPVPRLFFKPPSAVIGPDADIRYPRQSRRVEYEAELAVVMGRTARGVRAADAQEYVFGYTCANDVTARDIQETDGQPSWAKAFDTFCPLGPWVVTGIDPGNLGISSMVNGEYRQRSHTSHLLTPVPDLIEYITAAITLDPGDVILTGTPAGVGPLQPGDGVSVAVDQIGTLRNTVVSGADQLGELPPGR